MHILLFFFLLIFIILAVFGSIVIRVLRLLFGFKPRAPFTGSQSQQTYRDRQSSTRSHTTTDSGYDTGRTTSSPQRHKKIFGKDEGEYVDFEEIKEN